MYVIAILNGYTNGMPITLIGTWQLLYHAQLLSCESDNEIEQPASIPLTTYVL